MNPLDEHELSLLATYNAERSRGLIHTVAWRTRMIGLHDRFDNAAARETTQQPRRRFTRLDRSGGPARIW